MRILLITSYFEPDSGAAAVRLSRLAKALQRRGLEITVLTAMPHYPQGYIADPYRGKFTMTEVRDGVRIVRAWLWATPSPKISRRLISQMSFMLTAALRGLFLPRPDVVLIEAQPIFTALIGVFLSRLKGTPYVLNVSDLWPDHLLSVGVLTRQDLVYRLARKIVDKSYRGAAGIVALSPTWAEAIAHYIGTSDKIKVILNGVDLRRFRPGQDVSAFRQKYHLQEDRRLVSFIGTFATQYDLETMLAVVRHLKGREDVHLVFIGGGSRSEALLRQFEVEDLAHISWIGWIDHAEMPLAWAASYLTFWALRSHHLYHGTIPAKLYEALASGVPVVAASEGESAKMIAVSGAGLTVNCGNTQGLIEAIECLLSDTDLRRKCSESGRCYAEKCFDPERITVMYETVLHDAST